MLMSSLKRLLAMGAILFIATSGFVSAAQDRYSRAALGSPTIADPISVYDNWSVYDELSDHVPLTQALSMRELDNMLRLRKSGVRFDYYVMDAFWFDPDGGYRTWKKPNWPDGPETWIKECQNNGIRPGQNRGVPSPPCCGILPPGHKAPSCGRIPQQP